MGHWSRYSTTEAEKTFRPLLDLIDFANLNLLSVPLIFYSDLGKYFPPLKEKKCRLVLVVRDGIKNDQAYTVLHASGDENTIIINFSGDLFNGSSYDVPMIRNVVGIHEFLHCISIFFSIPELDNKKREIFINECKIKMIMEILSIDNIIGTSHNQNIMGDRTKLFVRDDKYFYPNSIFFSDDHFRLSLDKSLLKYNNLHERFLLPKDKFETFFSKAELKDLKKLIGNNKLPDAHTAAQNKINIIADQMNLEPDFVFRRMGEILLSYAL